MSEGGDYSPCGWKGFKFGPEARVDYDENAGRSYDVARQSGKTLRDLLPDTLTSLATAVGILALDETGSMGDWPGIYYSKAPYVDHETKDYLGGDAETALLAFDDFYCDLEYPIQSKPFASGQQFAENMRGLVRTGMGGTTEQESAEVVALYCTRKVHIPNAERAVLTFITDEAPYPSVDPEHARRIGISLQQPLSTAKVFAELKKKFEVYLIRKPYHMLANGAMDAMDCRIHGEWERLIGADHIALLPEKERVADVYFAILAKVVGRENDFLDEIEQRQEVDTAEGLKKIQIVYKAIESIYGPLAPGQRLGAKRPRGSTMHPRKS